MSRAWLWFMLSCKRYVKKFSFLLILLILPIAVRGIKTAEESGPTEVRIAVFAEGMEDTVPEVMPLEQKLARRLAAGAPGDNEEMIKFYLCGSEQQVKDEVASKRAECGYVIDRNLQDKLEKKNFKRSIRVYSAPSTVTAGLSSEVVFAALMELYDKTLFIEYAGNSEIFDEAAPVGSPEREAIAEHAGELYDTWLRNGSTFRFVSGTAGMERPGEDADSVFPVRGIAAVYIFVIGLYAAAMNLADEKKGLFLAVPYNTRTACRISSMAAPVFLAAVSGLAAIWSGGAMTGGIKELAVMAFYVMVVSAFSWLLRILVKSTEVICCLIPFFLIGSLLFCPVILDAGRYLPAVKYVQKFFLPWYYLKFFS